MKRNKILKICLALAGVFLLLFTVLVVHIAMVTNPKDKPYYGIQLSRIDFTDSLSAAEAAEINTFVQSIKGVERTMYSPEHHNLVFTHQLSQVSGQEVYEQLRAEKHVSAIRFILTPEEIAQTASCPVINNKGLLQSLAHKIQEHFL